MSVYFIETAVFTQRVSELGLESALRELQDTLSANPDAGATESGTGGLRKIRIKDPNRNKGKRGGARVHYLFLSAHGVIYLVFAYGKGEQASLTNAQKKQLKAIAERIRSEWGG